MSPIVQALTFAPRQLQAMANLAISDEARFQQCMSGLPPSPAKSVIHLQHALAAMDLDELVRFRGRRCIGRLFAFLRRLERSR